MRTLVFGAGNLLFTDEGFGVHCISYLQEHYDFPEEVILYDGGTLGIMASHVFEESERLILVDLVAANGEPGEVRRYGKDDILLNRVPTKMSPHQIGIQEMLTLSELRERCPQDITLFGIIPASYETSIELSPVLAARLPKVAALIVAELRGFGYEIPARLH